MAMSMPEEESRRNDEIVGRRTAVIKIDPLLAEENLFQKLQQQVVKDGKIEKLLKKFREIESGPQTVMALVHVLMRQVLANPLGYIIPPEYGAGIVKDRIVQLATILLNMLAEEVDKFEKEIEQALKEKKDYEVEQTVSKMIALHQNSLIAIREIMNRLLVLYLLNHPPELRPPLAQVKLGMEVISTE